jgi:hypothetical protein
MTFVDDFPSLDMEAVYDINDERIYKEFQIMRCCLDKQKVIKAIMDSPLDGEQVTQLLEDIGIRK